MTLVEPINSSKTITLAIVTFSHLVNTELCYNDFIFKDLLILTFKSIFKWGELLKILCQSTRDNQIILKTFFHIQYPNVVFKSNHH